MHINYYELTLALQTYTVVMCIVGLFGNVNLIVATCRHKSLRTKMGCLIMISTIAHTICLVSELIAVKLKLRFTQTHRDECFRSVIVYMFAVLFQSTLFLMMAIDLFLAVLMPIRHKLWRRGPYLLALCVPPLAFSSFALFIEEVYINHDDLLICTVTLAAPPAVRFWGTLITFSTIFLAVVLIFITAFKVHINERESARRVLRHSNSITSNTKCTDAKLLKSLSTLMFVFICSWSLSIFLSHISLYFHKSVAYEIQKYNILLSLPTFCQNFFVTGLRSPSESNREFIDFNRGRRIFDEVDELESSSKIRILKLDNNGYAFSAFTDDRNGNMGYKFVRVMMIITGKDKFDCLINGRKSDTVSLYEFSENHGMKWQLFILNCKLPNGIEFRDVESVTISRKITKASLEVPISYRIQDEKSLTPDEYEMKMSICVPTLFGNVYDAKRIIEFIELNSLQGIERIFMYYDPNEMADEKVKRTLQYYQDNNILEPVEFKLPFKSSDIWYHGQLAAITDCLLRNTGISHFTFFHDIDEFFVPVEQELSLYETLSKIFANSTIGSQRTSLKYISTKIKEAPVTLNNIVSSKLTENRFTKCVVRSEMVFEQGIHHTSRVIQDNYQTAAHDGSLLRVYHYKEPKYCCTDESLLTKRHGDELRKQFDYVVRLLQV